jgi:hypothetical protein
VDVPASDVVHLKYRVGQGAHDLLGTPPLALCSRSMTFVSRIYDAGAPAASPSCRRPLTSVRFRPRWFGVAARPTRCERRPSEELRNRRSRCLALMPFEARRAAYSAAAWSLRSLSHAAFVLKTI